MEASGIGIGTCTSCLMLWYYVVLTHAISAKGSWRGRRNERKREGGWDREGGRWRGREGEVREGEGFQVPSPLAPM